MREALHNQNNTGILLLSPNSFWRMWLSLQAIAPTLGKRRGRYMLPDRLPIANANVLELGETCSSTEAGGQGVVARREAGVISAHCERADQEPMSETFNYIAFGDRDYVKNLAVIEMTRGRMFEYTPTDIEKRLETLDADSLAFLEKLPTFLCSEIAQHGNSFSVYVKYGRLAETTLGRKGVTAKFDTLLDFGEVVIADVDQARDLFFADRFQLYRTHWAVRHGDAHEILSKLAQLVPGQERAVQAQLRHQREAGEVKPPERTKNIIGSAGSVEEFLQHLYKLPPKEGAETFFRGHSDAKYELTPSLLRRKPDGAWQFMPNEDRLCKELLIAHYEDFQVDQYCFDRLVRMQHYGLPTRLLDISGNPLVALFFACSSTSDEVDKDGEVIIFHASSNKVKYYDSDTVSCLANLSNLTYAQKGEFDLTLDCDKFAGTPVAKKLLHHIKSEKGFFENRIIPDHLGSILCVKAKRTNTRIKSQSGAFLLFGHEATLPENGQEGIEIQRVTITAKQQILRQLDHININATTVYPSIDQTAVRLRERYLADPSA